MNRNIAEWSKTCLAYQRSKIYRHIRNSPQHIPVPDTRFHQVHLDIVGPLPESRGFRYCLTLIDRFTSWPEAVPIPDATAETIISAFYASWIACFGAPAIITTDRGSQFESKLFEVLRKLTGSHRTRTTAYHPASNGLIERWHRFLKAAIMCYDTSDWTTVLPTVLLGLRISYKEDIRASAAEIAYGTTLRLPGEFFVGEELNNDPQIFKEELREHMRSVRSAPTAHHDKRKAFAHATLYECTRLCTSRCRSQPLGAAVRRPV